MKRKHITFLFGDLTADWPSMLACLLLAASTALSCAGSKSQGGSAHRSELPRSPHPVEGGWLFSYKAPAGARTVHLAGEFNNWSTSAWPMDDADGDGIWTLTASLESGREYQYKFVVNGSQWVTDPLAKAVDSTNFNNAILFAHRPGEPYLSFVSPTEGGRYVQEPGLAAVLHLEGRRVVDIQVFLSDFMEEVTSYLDVRLDEQSGMVEATLPDNLPDDEYRLTINIAFADASPLVKEVRFSIDRWQGSVDAPAFYDSAVVYEIFVRSFRDGQGNDSIGDLAGLTDVLDYLNDGDPHTREDLGVDVLWLMPVHPSPSYHGYDVADYRDVHPDYGTMEDYRTLVEEAHRRGIRVILDYVVNHSSDEHPFFTSSLGNPSSPYGSWYKFKDEENLTYDGFYGISGMPEFDFQSRSMRQYMIEMARFWMDLDDDGDFADGVDGFRCDVAKGPPHHFWKELRRETKVLRGDFLLLGEVWDNAQTIAPYFHDEFDMNFDYPLYYAILDLLRGRTSPDAFLRQYEELRLTYPAGAQLVRFLDNHDNNRIASVLGSDKGRMRLAAGLLLTLPGTPLLYYGTEVGMEGTKPDPNIRKPMRWDLVGAQRDDSLSLLSWHRDLIRLRRAMPSLRARDDARTRSLFPGRADDPDVLVYQRSAPSGGDALVVVANLSSRPLETSIALAQAPVRVGRLAEITPPKVEEPGTLVDLARWHSVPMEPYQIRIFRLTPE